MTDTKDHTPAGAGSPEGRVFRPSSSAETAEAVELAFDYRGDVTLELKSGETLTGYVFNRDHAAADPWIEVFSAADSDSRRIAHRDILSIGFTGVDTANGKSWETWVSKKQSDRLAEAARVEADARTRGHL
jgi:transcriptional antiterminator Rof (Rho-off)